MDERAQILAFDILRRVIDQPEADRPRLAREACNGDDAVLKEVESLLRAHWRANDFMTCPTASGTDALDAASAPGHSAIGSTVGRYHIVSLIGEGGFGSVFRARQERPVRRDVALKIIKPGMDTKQVITRFHAERQALAMMDHPHIARVYDAGATDSGRPYFVMELVDGVPVTRYCDERKLTIPQRLGLFIQVCHAVQHAHGKGIIHRDLKPSNVLVAEHEGRAVPKVIDFGIAKATQGRLTEQSFVSEDRQWLGTPQYMPPEQAEGGRDIDTRSDVYMLGVLLYELLTGQTPFAADALDRKSAAEIQRIIREVEPKPPSTRLKATAEGMEAIASRRASDVAKLRRTLHGELDAVVLKGLEKDRARRYETADALAADLQRYLRNEPVTARPTTRLYRFRKLVRRNRLAFTSASVVLLALVVGLTLSTWGLHRATTAERAQENLRDDAEARRYISDMNLAQQALAVYNLGRAREILDAHRPKQGEKDRRGWEWRYLWQECRSGAIVELRSNGPKAGPVTSLAGSSDGNRLAVGRADGGLAIWDLPARREVAHLPAGDGQVLAAFSPHDTLLAYSSSTGAPWWKFELHVWDLRQSRELAAHALANECVGLAFSPDGRTLVTSTWGPNGKVGLWRVPRLELIRQFDAPQSAARQLVGSPFAMQPGFRLAAVAPEGKTAFIDLTTGVSRNQSNPATTLAFSPDGSFLATCPGEGLGASASAISFLDPNTGAALGAPLEGHLAWAGALVFWPDGRKLASASADRTIRLWDVSDPVHARPIGLPLRGHTQEVRRLALLPDRKTLVSGAKDGSVYLWDASALPHEEWHRTMHPHTWDFGRDGGTLIAVEPNGAVQRVTGRTFEVRQEIAHIQGEFSARVVDRGRILGYSPPDATVRLLNLETGRAVAPHPSANISDGVHDVTPEGYFLLHLVSDDSPPESDPINPRMIKKWPRLKGGTRNTIVEWDGVNSREVDRWYPAGTGGAACVLAKGSLRFSVDRDGVGSIKDRSTGKKSDFDLQTHEIEAGCFSPDATLLAVASSRTGAIGLWQTADLRRGGALPAMYQLAGFTLAPHCVVFSPDGTRLAAGSHAAEAIKLYDVATRQEVLTLSASGSQFRKIEFSADGNVLGASTADGELHLWRAPTMEEIDQAEAPERAL